jgi:hypothetical protein
MNTVIDTLVIVSKVSLASFVNQTLTIVKVLFVTIKEFVWTGGTVLPVIVETGSAGNFAR